MNYGKRKLPPPLSPDDGAGTGDDSVKRKFRNLNEKKRRDQFNLLISELAAIVCSADKKHDKTAILEQAIAFLESHNKNETSDADPVSYSWKPSFLAAAEYSFLMLEAMDCITIVMDKLGKVLTASENVEEKLNISQEELLAQTSLSERICDPSLISRMVKKMESTPDQLLLASCLLHDGSTKSQTTKRYRLVDLICVPGCETDSTLTSQQNQINCVVQTKIPCYSKTFFQQGDTCQSFKGKYSIEWKILQLESKSSSILGYQPFEIMGTSGYLYYHPEDNWKIANVHKRLLKTGCCKSPFYRMATKSQGWVWLQSEFYVSFNQWSGKQEHIEAAHRLAKKDEVMAANDNVQIDDPYLTRVPTPSPANPHLQPTRASVETSQSSRLFDSSIRQNRNARVGRMPPERVLDNAANFRRQEAGQSTPALLKPQFLSPSQHKLHSQLQRKYEELKNHISCQQTELEALANQLNLAASTRHAENLPEFSQLTPLWGQSPRTTPGQFYPPSGQPHQANQSQRLMEYSNQIPNAASNFPPVQLEQYPNSQQNCNQQ